MFSRWSIGVAVLVTVSLLGLDASAGKGNGKGNGGGGGGGGGGSLTNPALAIMQGADVYVATSGGTKEQVTSGGAAKFVPAWSPDGSEIAFLQDAGGSSLDLYVVGADGSGLAFVKALSSTGGLRWWGLSWFPGGDDVLYSTGEGSGGGDLHVLDVSAGTTAALGLDAEHYIVRSASVGPDLESGTAGYQGLICYAAVDTTADTNDIHVVEATTSGGSVGIVASSIVSLALVDAQTHPVWSPDGSQIAYLDGSSGGTAGNSRLMVVDFFPATSSFGTPAVLVDKTTGVSLGKPTWSPDGNWIAFRRNQGGSGGKAAQDIYRIRPDGTGLANMTNARKKREDQPHWNPAWTNDID